MMRPIDKVLACFPDAKKSGEGWMARCPAHEDNQPSLNITEGKDGRVLLKCFAGCSTEDVLQAAGLTWADLFPNNGNMARSKPEGKPARKGKPNGKRYATRNDAIKAAARTVGGKAVMGWPYHRLDGTELFWAVRFKTGEGKTYRPITSGDDGRWFIGDPDGLLPLYRLPELAGVERVYVVEGEKCADAGRGIGLVCTASAHGAQSPEKTDWTPLAGRDVCILPDNDEAGRRYAQTVATILLRLDPPARVRIVGLPGLPESGDLVEYVEMNRGGDE